MKKQFFQVGFSGGKDSTAMLLGLLERGAQIDEVVYCDTYMDFPAMVKHIEKVREIVESHGIKFTVIKNEHSFEHIMFEKGKSWPDARVRWCTGDLKRDLLKKHNTAIKKNYDLVQYVGFAADELHRTERRNAKQDNKVFPLIEWGMTEADCLKFCYDRGFTWDGLYEIFDRVSCWCCPLKNLEELRKLRKHFPDLWEKLRDMDNRTWRTFKPDWSVDALDARFQLEEEFEAKGLPANMRNKEFKAALMERISSSSEKPNTVIGGNEHE